MNVAATLWEQVRVRAKFACEYCGVNEVDSGGLLTVDHYRPKSRGGTDDLVNLLYCCFRCNGYKGDYWPIDSSKPALWNPRFEPIEMHLILAEDGRLLPITATGKFTLDCLQLNRAALVARRLLDLRALIATRRSARLQQLYAALKPMTLQDEMLVNDLLAALAEQQRIIESLLRKP